MKKSRLAGIIGLTALIGLSACENYNKKVERQIKDYPSAYQISYHKNAPISIVSPRQNYIDLKIEIAYPDTNHTTVYEVTSKEDIEKIGDIGTRIEDVIK